MTLHQLDVRLPDGPVQLLDPKNQAFLSGVAQPVLNGSGAVYSWVGWLMMLFFGGLLFALVGLVAYQVTWDSSLARRTEATVVKVDGDEVTYTYEVSGTSFLAVERSTRRSFYGTEGETTDIRYLQAVPAWSELDANHEPVEGFTFVGAAGFLAALIYAGRILVRGSQRLKRLAVRASHVLPATITMEIPGTQGSRTYVYEFVSPAGPTVRGNVMVGAMVRFPVPSAAAVLYADDATHHLL